MLGWVGLPLGGIAVLLAPIAMGALYRDSAFVAGALTAVPSVPFAFAAAWRHSMFAVVAWLILAPVALFLNGVLGRVGVALVNVATPVRPPDGVAPGSIAAVKAQAAVEQRRRGLILVVIFVSIFTIAFAADNRINAAADRRAKQIRDKLLAAPEEHDPTRLFVVQEAIGEIVRYRAESAALVVGVSYAWADRCVVQELESRRIHIERDRDTC